MVPVPMSMEPDPMTAALRATLALGRDRGDGGPTRRPAEPSDGRRRRADRGERGRAQAAIPIVGLASDDAASTDATAGGAAGTATGRPRHRTVRRRASSRGRALRRRNARANRRRGRRRDPAHGAADPTTSTWPAAEAGSTAADPRAVRTAKEAAQHGSATRGPGDDPGDVEGAARAWLAEINQINNDTREAAARAERSRRGDALATTLERLAVEADAARISAEQADEACIAAREALAACDEARALEAAALPDWRRRRRRSRRATGPRTRPDRRRHARARGGVRPRGSMGSRAGQDALILRILRGDRGAMQHAVARLAGHGARRRRRTGRRS